LEERDLRKLKLLVVASVAVLAVTAVAYAAQVNTYTVTGKTSPSSPGSKKKPLPIGLNFNYSIGEQSGQRPSPVQRYTIGFYGMQSNGGLFPKCTAAAINAKLSDSGCPKGSEVGSGYIINSAGSTADPTDTSISCNLNLTIYNSGQGRAAIFLKGGPTIQVQGKPCVISINQAIDAKYVSAFGGKGSALQFNVPANLLHPIGGVDNAVVQVQSTIKKLTAKSKGKTRGYYESVGCKSGKRPISVDFLSEAGQTSNATYASAC
jgi:hypothetical protein